MHNLLLFAASSIAFALSHAAVISERSCTPEQHAGILQVYFSLTYTHFPSDKIQGWLTPASTGHGFTTSGSLLSEPAEFYFDGCPGGDPFFLYCLNCGSSTGVSMVAVMNQQFDAAGNPDFFLLYNYAEADSFIPTTRRAYWEQSMQFTWDLDSTFIRPVTYNSDRSLQPPLYAIETDDHQIEFTSTAITASEVYALWWKEHSG